MITSTLLQLQVVEVDDNGHHHQQQPLQHRNGYKENAVDVHHGNGNSDRLPSDDPFNMSVAEMRARIGKNKRPKDKSAHAMTLEEKYRVVENL
jgi:hypothetical protein